MKRYLSALCIIGILAVVSCKKEDNEVTKLYLDGSISLSFPKYVEIGYSKTFSIDTLMTLSRPDNLPIAYYYREPDSSVSDTLVNREGKIIKDSFTITAPNSLGEKSFSFGSLSDDKYYGSSNTCKFNVVRAGFDEDASLTNLPISQDELSFTDPRDQRKYYYKSIGNTDWMITNLAWSNAGEVGKPYEESPIMDDIFGRFYTWEEASVACPAGWKLPADEDFIALAQSQDTEAAALSDIHKLAGTIMGDIYFNGEKMWEFWKSVKITNSTGLSILPVGYALIGGLDEAIFDGLREYAVIWTGDCDGEKAIIRFIYQDQDILYLSKVSKNDYYAPVRCVRNN